MTMTEQEFRDAAADLRKKAAEAEKKGYFDLTTIESAERLERYADQMKAEREQKAEQEQAEQYLRKMPRWTQHEAKKGYYKCKTGELKW